MANNIHVTEADPDLQAEPPVVSNTTIAQALAEMAALLEAQGDNRFRVAAYRRASETVAQLGSTLREIHRTGGVDALDALPGIGQRIAAAIVEMLETGHWQQLERLRGGSDPEALFRTIPGVGPDLAMRLHEVLGVHTLEALEGVVRAGQLETVEGIGPRRAAAIGAALTQMLDRGRNRRRELSRGQPAADPPVGLLLQVDRDYRAAAEADKLPKIAPKRFNPENRAWLPVLHTDRSGWHFTALFSNTARAHELGRTHDWVVVFAEDEAHREHACTVVTAGRGALVGQRVVRGREIECREWYAKAGT